jgi:hypothetical protein
VPETYAPAVHAGLGAHLVLTEYPGQEFHGQVVRTAEAIDPGTRTLRTEVDVANEDGRLLPGGYAQVHLEVKVPGGGLDVPVNALLFRSEGLRAVVVDSGHRTHLRSLTIGRDYGTSLEVLSGLKAEERGPRGESLMVRRRVNRLSDLQLPGRSSADTAPRLTAQAQAERPSTVGFDSCPNQLRGGEEA